MPVWTESRWWAIHALLFHFSVTTWKSSCRVLHLYLFEELGATLYPHHFVKNLLRCPAKTGSEKSRSTGSAFLDFRMINLRCPLTIFPCFLCLMSEFIILMYSGHLWSAHFHHWRLSGSMWTPPLSACLLTVLSLCPWEICFVNKASQKFKQQQMHLSWNLLQGWVNA